ncbi:hypothetical protein FOA52_014442 [Chlamydomonas sp. UWO 241]|nr:hypothetical protein FOA52_014442 [Chlamydomonas sp. UWO 241]
MGAIADKSRTLGQLEREQEHYWLSEFFRQRSDTPWTALVMGWFREENRLAAVLLEDLGWETITRVDADVKPGDRLQLMLIESGKGAAGPPRFSVTAHFPLSDEEEEGEEEEGEGSE